MNTAELIEQIREENPEVEALVNSHNIGNSAALNDLPADIIAEIQNSLRSEFGDTIELMHGSPIALDPNMTWNENSSFTNEFDVEFAGEDGYVVVARIPVERIKFYLEEENEFVITAGVLDAAVFTVREYFGL